MLCYHAVSPHLDGELSVTPDALERQLSLLISRGWLGATFTEAVLEPAHRTLAVTFDDAFASVRSLAEPILSTLGIPATVFAPRHSCRAVRRWSGMGSTIGVNIRRRGADRHGLGRPRRAHRTEDGKSAPIPAPIRTSRAGRGRPGASWRCHWRSARSPWAARAGPSLTPTGMSTLGWPSVRARLVTSPAPPCPAASVPWERFAGPGSGSTTSTVGSLQAQDEPGHASLEGLTLWPKV